MNRCRLAAFANSTWSDRDIFIPITIAVSYSNPMYGHSLVLTSLTSNSESATAFQSIISSAWRLKSRSSLSESLKRSVLKTGNAFLQLNFQKLSHFCFVHKDNAKWRGGSSGSLVLLLFTRFLWDCTEIFVYGSSKVYRSWLDVLGHSAHSPAQMFSDAAPGKGLSMTCIVGECYHRQFSMTYKVGECDHRQFSMTYKVGECDHRQFSMTYKVGECDHRQFSLTYKVCDHRQFSMTYKVGECDHRQCDHRQFSMTYKVGEWSQTVQHDL